MGVMKRGKNMKYNTKTTSNLENHPDAVTNFEGELAFKLSPLMDLYIKAASTLIGEPKYYDIKDISSARSNIIDGERGLPEPPKYVKNESELIKSIHEAIKYDPEFVLQLAVYLREKLYLRSVPLMILAEFANSNAVSKVKNARGYVTRTIQRADELTELVAYQFARNAVLPRKTKLPMMLKYGIADAFGKFSEYELAKYNREGAVKLRDVLFLTHPPCKEGDKRWELYDKITNDTLTTPETWEVMRSTGKMTWHDVINQIFNKDGKINNYMAQLRNLRNCLNDSSVTHDDIRLLCSMLSDKNAVLYSKQFPFRFLSAYRELQDSKHPLTAQVFDALETAIQHSIENIPHLTGTTLIASDVSGSMSSTLSKSGSIKRYDVGLVLSMMAHKFCDVGITGIFGDIWKVVPLAKYSTGILANSMKLHELSREVGWSTNGYKVIEYLLDTKTKVDRIMFFTDCQLWNDSGDEHIAPLFIKYQRTINPDVKLYIFDLSGYGNVFMPEKSKGVCILGGWSDRVFEFVKAFEETGANKVIEEIKKIKPKKDSAL